MFKKDASLQYEQFKPFIADIQNDEQFIGAGAESRVYRMQLPIGEYAIKIAKENVQNARGRIKDRGLITQSKIDSGLKGVGIEGLEQFVAGSPEDFTAVFEFVRGTKLNRSDDKYVDLISNEQKERFNQTVVEATEAGLALDNANPSGANAFYSPETGFTLIDYSEAYWPLTYRENWSAALRSLGPLALQAFANS